MTVLPELRAAVMATAELRVRPAAQPAPRRPVTFRAGMLAFGALLATGSALAATGVWRPQVGDEHRAKPTISASSVPAAQAAHFSVLRREPNAADHGEKVRYALRYLDGRSFHGVRTDAVRLLSAAGSGYVLVPSTHAAGKDDALCLFAIDPADGGGLSCWTTAEILGHKAVLFAIKPPKHTAAERAAIAKSFRDARRSGNHGSIAVPFGSLRGPVTISGLVPDEVVSVEVSDGSSTRRVKVSNNFFTATLAPPKSVAPPSGGLTVGWLDADGEKIAVTP